MDAAEIDQDIKLQRVSGELITAFDQSLGLFLRKPDRIGGSHVRSRVRSREAYHLIFHLLEPFQELPQLLDPHLPKWLPMLAEAFLEHLQMRRRRTREASAASSLLMPLPTAICKLIYTFCKIRGEKVIVRFLNVETKYLELLLSALEDAERQPQGGPDDTLVAHWAWEERYIVLLWLSHLMLAPFDLSTISSVYMEDVDLAGIPGFFWPSNTPGITVRVLPLAVKYLACPGKEREAAKALLVRMAMRKDMQQLGVLHALVQWALFWLRPRADEPTQSPYKYIGVLSFLAGILASSAETSDMERYSSTIFYTVNAIPVNDDEMSRIVQSSALAKKTIVKVTRSIVVSKLKRDRQDSAGVELLETAIGYLLESLADNDTPVRFSASKALSIVTLNLPSYMASEVVDTVLESLSRNVLLVNDAAEPSLPPRRDLTSVDPLEWHGLMLTLSHLLYRRSPPAVKLGSIIRALLLGLSFERRGPSGGSVGTNVRDAACFGIWALARRYSTQDLLAVPSETVRTGLPGDVNTSVLQIIATNLVVAASLDPAGNIRRGSSAALQELIGRHPDTVENGIALVQAVDYHAVARRSRAIHDVAVRATKLHVQYGEAILDALLGWRGARDADAAARRVAGRAYGTVMTEMTSLTPSSRLDEVILTSINRVLRPMKALQTRQVEERHGLLVSLAAILDQVPLLVARDSMAGMTLPTGLGSVVQEGQNALLDMLQSVASTSFRKPELIAEGICRLLISAFPILQADAVGSLDAIVGEGLLMSGLDLVSPTNLAKFTEVVSRIDLSQVHNQDRLSTILSTSWELINTWLARTEQEVIDAASEASIVLLLFSSPQQREHVLRRWADTIRERSHSATGAGLFCALTRAYPVVAMHKKPEEVSATVCAPLLERWAQDTNVDVRAAILQSLAQSEMLNQNVDQLLSLVAAGLEDYTTTARGDIGSHVRLQAVRATQHLWLSMQQPRTEMGNHSGAVCGLLLPILRLAAEKLDRVRVEAQATLAVALQPEPSSMLGKLTFSSKSHFQYLLNLLESDWFQTPFGTEAQSNADRCMDELLAGYVTSADTGNEDLVIASRAALTEYCTASQEHLDGVCTSLLRNLKSHQGQDRVTVPTLEITAFLFSVGIFQQSRKVDMKSLCLQAQKAGYKSGNMRKLEACIKVYGGVAAMGNNNAAGLPAMASAVLEQKRSEGISEAKRRLGTLMVHPWPRVRTSVVDEIWGLVSTGGEVADQGERLKGVDWGATEKSAAKALVAELGMS
ncbi:hypothetical protein M406DRAFT_38921 [Cryphonectria parasitica EP155]|uniref:Tubulin-specific chaperone D C-terminal domain-containing protein n=1 Tax=Cryphonectria parasitica (strain ATCC 38755 / EP155) TaxID=660469 RepID=A0A9P5CRT8_CRYP1|nr:uncharacterized protein M406DRAFT_38921 [Cryphonectria parasitica EP155]KAF3767450.1 hypothetical protein M406DRAFT_38921 [Cryphonectria parasitica EP155]